MDEEYRLHIVSSLKKNNNKGTSGSSGLVMLRGRVTRSRPPYLQDRPNCERAGGAVSESLLEPEVWFAEGTKRLPGKLSVPRRIFQSRTSPAIHGPGRAWAH